MKIHSEKVPQKWAEIKNGTGKGSTSLIVVTGWANGEGYDISINTGAKQQMLSLLSVETDVLIALLTSFHTTDAGES